METKVISISDEHQLVLRRSDAGVVIAYQSRNGPDFEDVDNLLIPTDKVAEVVQALS